MDWQIRSCDKRPLARLARDFVLQDLGVLMTKLYLIKYPQSWRMSV